MTRNPDDINNEYASLCMQLGEIHFRKQCLELEGGNVTQKMHQLGAEMAKARELEAVKAETKKQLSIVDKTEDKPSEATSQG
jgi:hypothetical protein